jgi:hypothetical protein
MEPGFSKELVMGYLVVQNDNEGYRGGTRNTVVMYPVTSAHHSGDEFSYYFPDDFTTDQVIDLAPSARVVGIMQAPFPSYHVKGWDVNGVIFQLGYEFPTLPQKDWDTELNERLDENGVVLDDFNPRLFHDPE